MKTPEPAKGEAMPKPRPMFEAPTLNAAGMSTSQLCRLFRIIDNLEETTNMAAGYAETCEDAGGDKTFLTALQEYLSEVRSDVVDALRERPASTDFTGQKRIATILQYEAWVVEFNKETVEEFAASSLAREAV